MKGIHINRPGSRHRFAAALAHRFSGEVPFFEFDVAASIVSAFLGRPAANMLALSPADHVEFLHRAGLDMGYLAVNWPVGRRNFIDDRGRVHYVDGTIKTRVDLVQIELPPLDRVRERIETFLRSAETTGLGCVYAVQVAPATANTAIGPTDFMLALHDDPGFVNEVMDRIEAYTLPLAECVAGYPLDACFVTGPLCATTGPIASPSMHQEFIFPRIKKVLEILGRAGIPVILHSDGDNSLFMDWIVEQGFAGLHPIQPGRGDWNIYRLKAGYGDRLCLFGNIDVASVLSRGTPAEVRADTVDHLRRLSPGGGYVCGSSHDIHENIPIENFRALAETICSYRHPG